MRNERIKSFEDIISLVKEYFLSKARQSASTEYLQQYFGIKAEICPTWLDVFWEDRDIDMDQDGQCLKEKGARISIRCSVRGYVTIKLFPCFTDSLKCREDGIILFHKLNPWFLGRSIFMSYLWSTFVSYSTVTAIDGNPSVLSRLFVNLIRYFCTKSVNGTIESTRLWHDLKIFVGVVFAIVTSSLFVYFLPSRDIDKVEIIEDLVEIHTKQIDSLVLECHKNNGISNQLDSIIFYQKLIDKNIKLKVIKNEK